MIAVAPSGIGLCAIADEIETAVSERDRHLLAALFTDDLRAVRAALRDALAAGKRLRDLLAALRDAEGADLRPLPQKG